MYIKSCPTDGNTHIFRSAVLAQILCFLTKCSWFQSPWELGELELVRRHQFFEAMLIMTVPGLRNIIFEEKCFFGKYFSKLFSEKIFSKIIFQKTCPKYFFWKNRVGGNFGFGGRARKITPVIYPLIFKNLFDHETGRRGSFLSFSCTDRRHFLRWCRIWGQKWRG